MLPLDNISEGLVTEVIGNLEVEIVPLLAKQGSTPII